MNIIRTDVNAIRINGDNPRDVKEKKFKQLVNSLLVFPSMLDIRPIVVDENMTALGGNQRARALQLIATLTFQDVKHRLATLADFKRYKDAQRQAVLDYWDSFFKSPSVSVIDAQSLTQEEREQFIIKDNASSGAWNWDKLANQWTTDLLNEWGLDIWGADEEYPTAQGDAETDDNTQKEESPKNSPESKKNKQTTICITLNDESQYSQVLASVELAVADYDVSIK